MLVVTKKEVSLEKKYKKKVIHKKNGNKRTEVKIDSASLLLM